MCLCSIFIFLGALRCRLNAGFGVETHVIGLKKKKKVLFSGRDSEGWLQKGNQEKSSKQEVNQTETRGEDIL